jgi:L-cystine transport system substrate-binding protein
MKKRTALLSFFLAWALVLAGCGAAKQSGSSDSTEETGGQVTKLKVAYEQTGAPVNYTDENGEAAGYDVEVMKLVDERLPQYEFEFIGTTNDDLLIGVETGKYDIGIKNAFYTEARAEKYIYPKENIGASNSGLIVRTEDKDTVKDLSDVARLDKKLIPIAPQDAQYYIVDSYNKAHPEDPIEIETSESFTVTDWPIWLSEGRYDAYMIIKSVYTNTIEKEDGAFHHLKDKLAYNGFTATKTYPLFNKKHQAVADAYDEVIKQLKEEGIIEELLVQYLGENTFDLLKENQ